MRQHVVIIDFADRKRIVRTGSEFAKIPRVRINRGDGFAESGRHLAASCRKRIGQLFLHGQVEIAARFEAVLRRLDPDFRRRLEIALGGGE